MGVNISNLTVMASNVASNLLANSNGPPSSKARSPERSDALCSVRSFLLLLVRHLLLEAMHLFLVAMPVAPSSKATYGQIRPSVSFVSEARVVRPMKEPSAASESSESVAARNPPHIGGMNPCEAVCEANIG